MIILGDKIVPYENTSFISSIGEIKNTKANSTLIFIYDVELLKYCYENSGTLKNKLDIRDYK